MQITAWPDIPFWEELAAAHPAATFFHSPLWHEIVTGAYPGYDTATLGFAFDDGSRAVLPMIRTKRAGLLRGKARLKSSVFGGYGGILAEPGVAADRQEDMYRHLASQRATIALDTNPFLDRAAALPPDFTTRQDATQALALTADGAAMQRGLNRGAKSNLNQARKQGVTVRQAASEADLQRYYDLYRDTLERWGDTALFTYPEEFFYAVFSHAGPRVKVWLAEKDRTIIAGAVIFYWHRIVSYWHGASHRDFFSCYPNNMLHMEIIRHAAAAGYGYYDFGPSGGQEGVARFKRSFGAAELPFVAAHRKYR